MWLIVVLAVILIFLTHWFIRSIYGYWKKRGVPHPPPKPLVGNLGRTLTLTKNIGQIYTEIYNEYKGYLYVGFYKMQQPSLLIRDVNLIKDLLIKDFAHFHDNDIHTDAEIDPVFGRNPFVLKGHQWKVVRSQVTLAITTGKIKNMFTIMTNIGKNLVTYLNNEPEAQSKDGLEAKELSAKFTTDVVASCAFGLEGKSFTDPDSEFRRMGRKLFAPTFWNNLKFTIIFMIPSLVKTLKVKIMSDEVQNWFVGILTETIKYREKNQITRGDYLDMMLSLKSKPGEYEFTDMDVIAQAMTFYVDGFETSSVTLSFALYELGKNPDIQEKLRKEVDSILAKNNGEITYEAVQQMRYLDNIVSETLRKHPPGLFLTKECTKTYTLPPPAGEGTGPNIVVEPGMPIVIPVYAIHHDPAYYPNPDKFDPDRFTDEAKSSRPKCAYMPFGEGPRQCLGFRFALAQIKAAIVSVVSSFEIKVSPKTLTKQEIDPKQFLLTMIGGLWITFHKRSNKSVKIL